MDNILEVLKRKRLYFDGAMGTMLQKQGLNPGELPETWNLSHPEIIEDVHRQYLEVGANIITTNTFGINCLKHANYEELIIAGITCAKNASKDFENAFIAFDIGPLGKFLKPIGDIEFEDAVEIFAKNIRVAQNFGADLVIIETMTDCYETKAAVLAAKENSNLPIFVTNAYDENGKTLTGASPEAMVSMLEGLRVDAIGINCSLGPDKMISLVEKIAKVSSLPIIANPNAGLPKIIDGKAQYSLTPLEFSNYAVELANAGASILGGCCGTNPDYIRAVIEKTNDLSINDNIKNLTLVSSYTHAIEIGDNLILIGERINPTGKSKFKDALRNGKLNYILEQGLLQQDQGADVLDVNVGLPEIDEVETLKKVVSSLQAVCDLPLQLDSNNPKVLEAAMRIYNGKPLVNSVTGDEESMEGVFPLIQKYGGTVIALTLDKGGIPETVDERIQIAQRILNKAALYGIDKKDIIFDPLALTIATNPDNMSITLESVKKLNELGLKTSLGISNISFGMPDRDILNAYFLASAIANGLSCAIVNPSSKAIQNVFDKKDEIINKTISLESFYKPNIDLTDDSNSCANSDYNLQELIFRGITEKSIDKAKEYLSFKQPLQIIDEDIIPALNYVGAEFENKRIFLPQLLKSAECSSKIFELIKEQIPKAQLNNNSIIMATVKGDIHDIGKNIVKLLLESHGFNVIDLGKDVSSIKILEAVKQYDVKIVGLSALMTTTLPAMEETVRILHEYNSNIKIMVGGAVLTQEYADMIKADAYAKDAMDAVKCVKKYI